MKLLLLLLFMPLLSFSQRYLKTDLLVYKTTQAHRPGAQLSAGYILKAKECKKRNYLVGVGAGLLSVDNTHSYAPIYAEAGYYNSFDNITHYVVIQAGYGFYKGSGKFIDVDKQLNGGVFMNVKAGAGFKIKRSFSIAPFIGLSYIMLRERVDKMPTNDYYKALWNVGLSVIVF